MSADYGVSWAPVLNKTNILDIAMSASGQYVGAAAYAMTSGKLDGTVYRSSDYGLTWAPTSIPVVPWKSVAMSYDAQYWLACTYVPCSNCTNQFSVSANAGMAWSTPTAMSAACSDVLVSASGQYQVVVAARGIYYSYNYGASFASVSNSFSIYSTLSLSANGLHWLAVDSEASGGVYVINASRPATMNALTATSAWPWDKSLTSVQAAALLSVPFAGGTFDALSTRQMSSSGATQTIVLRNPSDNNFWVFFSKDYGAHWTPTGIFGRAFEGVSLSGSGQFVYVYNSALAVSVLDTTTMAMWNATMVQNGTALTGAASQCTWSSVSPSYVGLTVTARVQCFATVSPFVQIITLVYSSDAGRTWTICAGAMQFTGLDGVWHSTIALSVLNSTA